MKFKSAKIANLDTYAMIVEHIYKIKKIFSQNQKNAIMIRLLILGVSLLMISCSRYSIYYPTGVIKKEYYSYYINDSLKMSYKFPADYEVVENHKEINRKLHKLKLPKLKPFFLGYFKTRDEPELEHLLFFVPTKNKKIISDYQFLGDSTTVDSGRGLICKTTSIEGKGDLLLLAFSKERYFRNLKNEYIDGVFPSLKIGSNYKSEMKFKDPFSLVNDINLNSDSTVNYLLPLRKLIDSENNYMTSDMEATYIQALSTYYSFFGNTQSALKKLNGMWQNKNYMSKRDDSNIKMLSYDSKAISQLVQECNKQRIVMINEIHFSPNHRMLVNLLLDSLYANGFRYFGLEGLWESELHARGFCISTSGFYTREPNMSNLVKNAMKKGYNVFGYDDYTNQRERNQANNIFNETFKKDSTARVLILAGFGHISERQSNGRNMMASEFYKNFGINPLTIDQCEFDLKIGESYIGIIDTNTIVNHKKLQADIYLSNNLKYDKFSSLMGYTKQEISIDDELNDFPYVLSFYDKIDYSENSKAIPLYNQMIENTKSKHVKVFLPNIDITWTLKNEYGKILQIGTLKTK